MFSQNGIISQTHRRQELTKKAVLQTQKIIGFQTVKLALPLILIFKQEA